MSDRLRAELQRVIDNDDVGAADARIALADGAVRRRLEAGIRALAEHRGPHSSLCPSDAARLVGGDDWRELMECTREVVAQMARRGEVQITQRGEAVDPDLDWHGPIRIRVTGHDL
ncbi:DUF3253 domain-containing protein [Mycobacterium sp. SMC-4]|uniref:DUF3253 domain-containing protein n=1 Tax=Mycobacterium sp. SMC-4 TaxID=2857059 RepID=UPI0021B29041|nr:DUF3253 domain-containing protein [Mycobacterium sp. SMC-4]